MALTAYRWLDTRLAGREWAAGENFGLAECAAAPALLYADWTHPIDASFRNTLYLGLSPPPAGAPVVRARGRRGPAVSVLVPAGGAGPGLRPVPFAGLGR